MKPLRVELQHFGPYLRHTVDLAAFRDEALFLVHGDTGAGKSTVLDAIAWALYGRGLGTRSEPDHLRSRSAPPDEPTAVTLEFSLGDRRFLVRRVMGFERPAKRGGGVTRQPPEAMLTCLAGDSRFEPVNSPRRVDVEIERLLGLPYEQFTRIIVLPQGEFRELLLARADDRERLLERLFGTGLYKEVEAELREMERVHERDVGAVTARVEATLKTVGASSREALGATLDDARATQHTTKSNVAAAEARVAIAEAASADARDRAARNAERATLVAAHDAWMRADAAAEAEAATLARAEIAAACEVAVMRAGEARTRLSAAAATLAEARAEMRATERVASDATHGDEALRTMTEAATLARARHARLEGLRAQLVELDADARALEQASRRRTEAARRSEALMESSTALEGSRVERARALEEARRVAQRETAAALRVEEIDARTRALDARREAEDAARESARALKAAERTAAAAREREARLRDERDEAWRRERASMAAALARTLQAGTPCPVCGSHEHPVPAVGAEVARAEADAREVEARYERARDERARAEVDLARLRGEHEALLRAVDTRAQGDGATAEELDDARREAARALDDARRARRTVEEAERALVTLAKEAQRISTLHGEEQRTIADALAVEAQLARRVESARERLAAEGVAMETLVRAAEEAAAEEARAVDALERAQRARATADARRHRATAAQEHVARVRDDAQREADDADDALAPMLRARGFDDEGAWREAMRPVEQREALRARVAARRVEGARLSVALTALGPVEQVDDLERCVAEVAAARDALATAQRELGSLGERLAQLTAVAQQVDVWNAEMGDMAQRWQAVHNVSEAANGRHEGKTRLSRYVLLEQFDRVAACASARLERMSDGRFRLRRREARQTGAEFDLVVDDAYVGSVERPVATLSGGEMFLASLSMALGLSDVVQAWAGGVRMESLFVDEGFGALDEEALDKAISVLESIGENRRMVGVVSHVPELRKRIPARLEVVRTEGGSATRTFRAGRAR